MKKVIIVILISFSLLYGESDDSFADFSDEFDTEQIVSSWDPLKAYNMPMTQFNDFIYMYIMGPVAKGYRFVVTKPVRTGISNAFHNIKFPVRLANNLLQLKFNNAFEESARFAINSTYGLAGFIDIAKIDGGLERHDEDFGQTLGFYGVNNDIHIVLPFLGPSNLRDVIGLVGDSFLNPVYYVQNSDWDILKDNESNLLLNILESTNEYSFHIDEYEGLRKDSLDLYLLMKSIYEQKRDAQIKE